MFGYHLVLMSDTWSVGACVYMVQGWTRLGVNMIAISKIQQWDRRLLRARHQVNQTMSWDKDRGSCQRSIRQRRNVSTG